MTLQSDIRFIVFLCISQYVFWSYVLAVPVMRRALKATPYRDWVDRTLVLFGWLLAPLWAPFYLLARLLCIGIESHDDRWSNY